LKDYQARNIVAMYDCFSWKLARVVVPPR